MMTRSCSSRSLALIVISSCARILLSLPQKPIKLADREQEVTE